MYIVSVEHYVLYTVQCTLYTIQCTVYTYILITINCIISKPYNVRRTYIEYIAGILYIVYVYGIRWIFIRYTVYNIQLYTQCTQCILHESKHFIQCTMYSMYSVHYIMYTVYNKYIKYNLFIAHLANWSDCLCSSRPLDRVLIT